jgi:L-ascorbate metabolism protein UlaG (beta-lactamase superfamily)
MRARAIAFGPEALRTSAQPTLRLRWLGTAGFELACEGRRLLIDPYLSRPSLGMCLKGALRPDRDIIHHYVPAADVIVVGHTHFDHALDVPAIVHHTGATVVGSRSAMALCRSAGILGTQLCEVEPSATATAAVRFGPFELECARSDHAPIAAGRIPFPGEIDDAQGLPLYAHQYRCGTVLRTTVRVAGRKIVHLGSAAMPEASPATERADLVLLCVSGWHASTDLPERAVRQLAPRAALLSHWDNFFRPLRRPLQQLPGVRLGPLVQRLRRADPDVAVGTVPPFAPQWL